MERTRNSRVLLGVSLAFIMALALMLSGCQSDPYAAKVNNTEIKEAKVTKYIESIRKSYGYETDSDWASYLSSSSYTPETLRTQVLDNFIEQEIVKQYASEKDCLASDDEINSTVSSMKSNYSSDDAWKTALEGAGFSDEDDYKASLKYSMSYQKLQDKFKEETTIDDQTLLDKLSDELDTYDGAKRSSHILFASTDTDKANEVLARAKAGEDFAALASEFSTDTETVNDGGNVGWDKATSLTTNYSNALENLDVDQISDLVTDSDGIHIIKCTGTFSKPAEVNSLDQVPSDMLDDIRDNLKSSESSTKLSDWITEKTDSANVERKDMPSDVSYNVDMSKYTSTSSSSSDSSSSDSSSSTESESSSE